MSDKLSGNWKKHTITRLDPEAPDLKLPALFQYISDPWPCPSLYPFMQYMPEKHRLIVVMGIGVPHVPYLTFSDDAGATWTQPRLIRPDATRGLANVCYLGNGRLIITGTEPERRFFSSDYGQTWPRSIPIIQLAKGAKRYDPGDIFVDRDPKTGEIVRLISVFYEVQKDSGRNQAYIHFSKDGITWTQDVRVPQWLGFNEVLLLRAANGDMVAALRSELHERYIGRIDHFEGLGISISKDNAKTWSPVKMLYGWGRHHQSLVLMPNGDIVMTYVVRVGYPPAANRNPQFGVEAIVSHDNGGSWDMDHIYVLHEWVGHLLGTSYWGASPQITSTVLLPDGDLLTIFGAGEREMGFKGDPRHIGLVRWRLAE